MERSVPKLVGETAAQEDEVAGEMRLEVCDSRRAERVPIDHTRAAEERLQYARFLIALDDEELVSTIVNEGMSLGRDLLTGHVVPSTLYEAELPSFEGQMRRYLYLRNKMH